VSALFILAGLAIALGLVFNHINFIGLHAAVHLRSLEVMPTVLQIERWGHLEHHRMFPPKASCQRHRWADPRLYIRRLGKDVDSSLRLLKQNCWSGLHLLFYLRATLLFLAYVFIDVLRGEGAFALVEGVILVGGLLIGFVVHHLVLMLHHNWLHAGGPFGGWHRLHHEDPRRIFGLWRWCDFEPSDRFLSHLLSELRLAERLLKALFPSLSAYWQDHLKQARENYQQPSIIEPQ